MDYHWSNAAITDDGSTAGEKQGLLEEGGIRKAVLLFHLNIIDNEERTAHIQAGGIIIIIIITIIIVIIDIIIIIMQATKGQEPREPCWAEK